MVIFERFPWLRRWETLLLVLLVMVIFVNSQATEFFFDPDNIANIFSPLD